MKTFALEVIDLTPELAEKFLSKNTNNRNVNGRNIAKYAHDMEAGNWRFNGESIKIAKDKTLIDGQQRCLAVIRSGKTIKTCLISGLEKDVIVTIDTGKSRNAGNVFQIEGIQNATTVSSSVSTYILLKLGVTNSQKGSAERSISNTDILEEYNKNPSVWQELSKSGSAYYKKWFGIISPSRYSAFYMFFKTKYTENVIDSFFDSIIERKGVGGMLFDKLMNDVSAKRRMSGKEKTALIIKAFINHAKGTKPKILIFAKDEKFPQI